MVKIGPLRVGWRSQKVFQGVSVKKMSKIFKKITKLWFFSFPKFQKFVSRFLMTHPSLQKEHFGKNDQNRSVGEADELSHGLFKVFTEAFQCSRSHLRENKDKERDKSGPQKFYKKSHLRLLLTERSKFQLSRRISRIEVRYQVEVFLQFSATFHVKCHFMNLVKSHIRKLIELGIEKF